MESTVANIPGADIGSHKTQKRGGLRRMINGRGVGNIRVVRMEVEARVRGRGQKQVREIEPVRSDTDLIGCGPSACRCPGSIASDGEN
jgi:hypothetical protein